MAVLAGVAWPWAWLSILVLLGYFFRSGLQAFASLAGLLGGVAGTIALLTWLTPPSVPRADGALLRAEQLPPYTADLGQDGMLHVAKREGDSPQLVHGWLRSFWKLLIEAESVKLDPTTRAMTNGCACSWSTTSARKACCFERSNRRKPPSRSSTPDIGHSRVPRLAPKCGPACVHCWSRLG